MSVLAYLSLYRKWRPQTFDDVVGQEHVVRTLKNALDARRVAHAYMFAGPRGTGKTTLARLLAKGLNCEKGPTGSPCNQCANCIRIAQGSSVDVIEIDGASNRGIDEIRDVRERVKFAPAEGEYKVYIIDEVHMLTTEAFNALLKVLEEPPRHVVFVFATTEPHRIPATIVSRCQKFDFRPLAPDEIVSHLRKVAEHEGVSVEAEALELLARHAGGGMRDALSYLDQCIAFGQGSVTQAVVAQALGVVESQRIEELAESLAAEDLGRCLLLVKEVADAGRDLRQFAADAVRYFRDLLVLTAAPGSDRLVYLPAGARARAREMAGCFSLSRLVEIIEALGRAESDMRWASTPQLSLELALIQLLRGEARGEWQALARRVEALERRLETLGAAPPASLSAAGDGAREAREQPEAQGEVPAGKEEAIPAGAAAAPGPGGEVSPEPAVGDPQLLALVRSQWPRVLEQLRAARFVQQEAFLREGVPAAVQGDTVIVAFSPSHRFHQANMEKDKNRQAVEKVMSQVFGRPLKMRAVLSSGSGPFPSPADSGGPRDGEGRSPAGPPRSVTPERARPGASPAPGGGDEDGRAAVPGEPGGEPIDPAEIDEPIVRAALNLFGGRITRIERTEAE
ncbi:MAG: DNA polymerase III subunit gamma/tau [Limnochordia bacterium]